MELHSLTYTSEAASGLSLNDVAAIHEAALTYNPLDGVTGLLIFNGSSFLQMIEGAESAIDDLLARLEKDKRHHSIKIRDRRIIARRFFPHWSMHRLDVPGGYQSGMAVVKNEVGERLDDELIDVVDQSLGAISSANPSD
nr:BLUF domain-containing protein [uncultured Sphingomonas sp.]